MTTIDIELADGRRLQVDDVGDPAGTPVLYFHGTPDSRLARHPDDGVAAALGVRLIAVDRPGIGGSDPDPGATPASIADDLVDALDAIGVTDGVGVLAWSAGSICALAFSGRHPGRVQRICLVAPLIPADAYDAAGVLEGADDGRRLFAEHLGSASPDELASELAMWLVPPVIDAATAAELLGDSIRAVADIPGAGDQLVRALQASVQGGLTGIEREIAAQAAPLGDLLDRIEAPTSVHVGADDTTAPPPMAEWIAERLGAELGITPDVGHALMILGWERFLGIAAGV